MPRGETYQPPRIHHWRLVLREMGVLLWEHNVRRSDEQLMTYMFDYLSNARIEDSVLHAHVSRCAHCEELRGEFVRLMRTGSPGGH